MDLIKELHNALTAELLQRIRSGEAQPKDLDTARQFLRDNGVDASLNHNKPLMELADNLPFEEDAA
jgi:hypothetical protein